jgi:hypothetical protein
MQEPFNIDRYKQRQTQQDSERIARETEEFLANGGEIQKEKTGIQSGVCDLCPKEIGKIKKKLGLPHAGEIKKGAK